MKKHIVIPALFLFLVLFVSSSLHSQSPLGIPYQAVMRHADGSVMANSAVSLTFMIHDGTANGTVVYQESHALTSNTQGLVSCVVGNGVVSQGNSDASLSQINWGNGAKFLHVMMGSVDLGTQQMLSVPYALHSSSADNATNAQNAANGFSSVSQSGDTLYMANGTFIIVPGISAANFPPTILGCTDNAACNYNSAAAQNDNSCLYLNTTCNDNNANTMNDVINGSCECAGTAIVNGCTNAQACNYNSAANVDNGSCLVLGAACNDNNTNTTNDVINGSCVCAGTAVGNGTYVPGNGATDIDGNTYTSIIINGQEWMQQNLAVTKYRNGDPIPTGLSNTTWQSTTSGAYAIYNNDAANNTLYGKLFNWYAVNDSRGLCPTGWHVPSDAEWTTLETNLGGSNVAGGKMKAITGWNSPNTGATNESGFTAFPGGYRNVNGSYDDVGNLGYWWSSSEDGSSFAWYRSLYSNNSDVDRDGNYKRLGFSVRCVRDSETPPIQGCTDGAACNFMANANQDDGSCLYPNTTCDDGNANTINDVINGSCECAGMAIVNGCTNAQACNFNASANVDNGSCLIQGAACNDNNANTTNDVINGSCECTGTAIVNGCTNAQACNYNPAANVDNGSCLIQGTACNDNNANTTNDVINGSCVCAGTAVNNNNVVIGQDYQGGKVAYIFQPGDAGYVAGETHGLIAAAQDLGLYQWGCYGTAISGADGQAIGTGAQNTVDIVNAGCGGAAQACADLVLNGYSDWFLPSLQELIQLYNNRTAIGGFQNAWYWSSSEGNSSGAWTFYFYYGATNGDGFYKNGNLYVRAVRAF